MPGPWEFIGTVAFQSWMAPLSESMDSVTPAVLQFWRSFDQYAVTVVSVAASAWV